MYNLDKIREQFPILSRNVYGKPLVYLDNGATTQKPRYMVDKIVECYYEKNANVHRGVHFLSQEATDAHEHSRVVLQHFVNAKESREIIFTRGTTEAINLVASSFGERFLNQGDEIIISEMEHHANIVPWQLVAERKGCVLRIVPINEAGELCMDVYASLFTERTKIVAITHVSNVLGTINPVKEIIDIAHTHNVPVLLDGAQAVPHLTVDVQALDVDFYVFSAHKVYGPTGIGVLYGKASWLEAIPPYQGGGEMIAKVTFDRTTYNDLPYKFEAGTPDYIGSTAFAKSIEFIQEIGMQHIAHHEHLLLQYATQSLMEIEGMRIFGTSKHKSGVISFLVGDIHHYDMGMLLDKLGIAVRTGHHCAQPLMQTLGIEGTVRASFGLYNTMEEVDLLVAAVRRVAGMFR